MNTYLKIKFDFLKRFYLYAWLYALDLSTAGQHINPRSEADI